MIVGDRNSEKKKQRLAKIYNFRLEIEVAKEEKSSEERKKEKNQLELKLWN